MPWLIDSDILIEGERENPAFVPWLALQAEVATADIIRAEFLIGVHAVPDAQKRLRGELFYRHRIAGLASLPCEAGRLRNRRAAGRRGQKKRQRQSKPRGWSAGRDCFAQGGKGCDQEYQGLQGDELSLREPLGSLPPPAGPLRAGATGKAARAGFLSQSKIEGRPS